MKLWGVYWNHYVHCVSIYLTLETRLKTMFKSLFTLLQMEVKADLLT